MTHVIYLTVITLLVAAGVYIIWEIKKRLSFEKEMRKITDGMVKLHKSRVLKLKEETELLTTQIERLEKHINCVENIWDSDIEEWEKSMSKYESEITTLKSKLQSAYGRIGALTQQVSRLKKEGEKKAAKVEVKKVELPKECPEHLFEEIPEKIRQMAWEAMCSTSKVKAQRAYEKKNCYSLDSAFMWYETPQGRKFWWSWYEWGINGANPNNMPPTDPNDPVYK